MGAGRAVMDGGARVDGGLQATIRVGPDECPTDPAKVAAGQCGCGNPDTDTDGDGVANCLEPVLLPVADTTLRLTSPFANDGMGRHLGVTSASVAGIERALIRFDQGEIAQVAGGRPLESATLDLTVDGVSLGWGGGELQLMPMLRDWPEGTGTDTVLGAHGPSWACANDTNTSLLGLASNDCAPGDVWGMEPWDTAPLPPPGPTPPRCPRRPPTATPRSTTRASTCGISRSTSASIGS